MSHCITRTTQLCQNFIQTAGYILFSPGFIHTLPCGLRGMMCASRNINRCHKIDAPSISPLCNYEAECIKPAKKKGKLQFKLWLNTGSTSISLFLLIRRKQFLDAT